jgi:hypothetical protein
MRKFIHLKFISAVLLLAMLIVTINGAHESAHAVQSPVNTASSAVEAPAADDTPCTPFEHHQDYDGCDSCVNCACHASMPVLSFKLSYNPIILDLSTFDPFKHLPEVYLSRFIPPQIQA